MGSNVREYPSGEGASSSNVLKQRASLFTQAWTLLKSRNYRALADLLEPFPQESFIAEPELGYLFSAALRRVGDEQRALYLLYSIERSCGNNVHPRLFLECTNLTGATLLTLGRPSEAERYYHILREYAIEIDEQFFVAAAGISLGIIADIRCFHREALAEFQRAIPWLYRSGMNRELAAVHHNLGMVHRHLNLLDDALNHFEHARFGYRLYGSEDDLIQTDIERALTVCQMGDQRLAGVTIERAHARAERLNLRNLVGEALRVRGIVALARDDRASARSYLSKSLEAARATTNPLLEAEVLEELAVLEQAEGKQAEAENLLAQSERVYHQIGSPARAQRARQRIFPTGESNDNTGPHFPA